MAVAASAGGVTALQAFASGLPEGFPAAVLIVLHISATGPTMLPHILSRAGPLPARHPADGELLAGGVILVAPPDRHLAVSGRCARVLASPPEHGHRPSADVLLGSAAAGFGTACCGVVLTGTMTDGAAGLAAVRRAGGLALVQDPAEAAFPGMPQAAIAAADPQLVAPVSALTDHLTAWVTARAGTAHPPAARTGQAKLLREVPGDPAAPPAPPAPDGDPDGRPA